MNLSSLYIVIETFGWCFVALAMFKGRSKPKCSSAPTARWWLGLEWIAITLGASTLSSIYAAAQENSLLAMLAFSFYALAWLRFEARYDARKMTADKNSRHSLARRMM